MFGVQDDALKIAYYLYQNRNSEKLIEIIENSQCSDELKAELMLGLNNLDRLKILMQKINGKLYQDILDFRAKDRKQKFEKVYNKGAEVFVQPATESHFDDYDTVARYANRYEDLLQNYKQTKGVVNMQPENFPSALDINDFIEQKKEDRSFKDIVDDGVKNGSVSDEDMKCLQNLRIEFHPDLFAFLKVLGNSQLNTLFDNKEKQYQLLSSESITI